MNTDEIKQAFGKTAVRLKAHSKPGELIPLRHAMKNYLGRDSGLAAVIRGVIDGSLVTSPCELAAPGKWPEMTFGKRATPCPAEP